MADQQWQKVREVFEAARLLTLELRQDYIVKACGENKLLLTEVESLLASFDSADDFFKTPAVAKVADSINNHKNKFENGVNLGHYKIIESIGTGGMGEVYLANDQKLDRQVAIKILNEKFSRDKSNLNRFIQEAKSASALNHPNILVIHEIGESDEAHFIVSEYIKGKTLREILKEQSLNLSEILDISIQIANALIAAHEARLVHRDIKPENIMMRPDGYVKILDFGLAKLVERKNKSILGLNESTAKHGQTAKGVILGTVNYMSPEQAKGERVDERTDIFSLGVVIYEMLAGNMPFAGEINFGNFCEFNQCRTETAFRFGFADELRRIVSKMLRKRKDERYQTMKDVLADLKDLRENLKYDEKLERSVSPENGNATEVLRATTGDANLPTAEAQNSFSLTVKKRSFATFAVIALLIGAIGLGYYFFMAGKTASSVNGKKSIAVLPLKPITANRDEIYEMGIADSLIHRLGAMKGFFVRPLSATRKYSDLNQDPVVAGREQQTDYVLASNYQLANGKIRVTAQLFNVQSGQIEETKIIEKDAGDIFAAQDAIAGEVVNFLLARFATTSTSPAAKRGTTNEEAYRLYLQGKNLTAQRSAADAKKAIGHFEQAIKLDPNFARAFAGMANAYRASGTLGGGLPREEFEKAKAAVTKALELDPNLSEAYAVRGGLKLNYEWDWAGAEKDLLHAIELEPNNDTAHGSYSGLLVESGRFDDGIAQLDIAQAINPSSLIYQRDRGRYLYFARRYDEAIVQLKRVIEVDENFRTAYGWLWQTYQMKGDHLGAYEWFMKFQKIANPESIEPLQKAYETAGWQGVRRKRLEIDKQNEHQPGSNLYAIARQSALLGEKEQAFEYLNKAIEKRHSQLVMLKVEPAFDNLRDDPRFDELVKRVGLK